MVEILVSRFWTKYQKVSIMVELLEKSSKNLNFGRNFRKSKNLDDFAKILDFVEIC